MLDLAFSSNRKPVLHHSRRLQVVSGAIVLFLLSTCWDRTLAQDYPPLGSRTTVVSGGAGANGVDRDGQGTDGQTGGGGQPVRGSVVGSGGPVNVISNGGDGGDGGRGIGEFIGADGGRGGTGGAGGMLAVRLGAGSGGSTITFQANGGLGGVGGGIGVRGNAGASGNGGSGGDITFDALAGSQFTSSAPLSLLLSLSSIGGIGGTSGPSEQTFGVTGARGGNGGDGGDISAGPASIDGTLTSAASVIGAVSRGGLGGDGGFAQGASATGGVGGNGGSGGSVSLMFGPLAAISGGGASNPFLGISTTISGASARLSTFTPTISASSFGGSGGMGGEGDGTLSGTGGDGGTAGSGGTVIVSVSGGSVRSSGFAAPGVFGVSAGGGGGSGSVASGGFFSKEGGSGGAGAPGGTVNLLDLGGSIATTGDASGGFLGQSIGGGGGLGADVQLFSIGGGVSVGGDGADGANGGIASVINGLPGKGPGGTLTTAGADSPAMLAQSIAGGGGVAGDAVATVPGVFAVAIGGEGGNGGNGGNAFASNIGALQTTGFHSQGMQAQSIGGGGGDGGFGSSLAIGVQYTAAVAVGGEGGTGGLGGQASATNAGQVTTSGEDSPAIEVQSIGGGGGNGGDALSRVFQLYNDPRIPSIAANVAVGGDGGQGANAGPADVDNEGAVLTAGSSNIGVLAQSIGGGGGDGGDAQDLNQSFKAANLSASVSVGGGGGDGGNGGPVSVIGGGAVVTLAKGAIGILAQSVGGGGGDGGVGDADTGSLSGPSNNLSAQVTVAVGGSGGTGGTGGSVFVNVGGGILTRGDAATGIYAQSVGGGGGNAGFGTALGSGGQLGINLGVGGRGGNGGDGGPVNAVSEGAVLTTGGSAPAIFGQSVGGGGGNGGDAATGGGTSPVTTVANFVQSGLGIGLETEDSGNGVLSLAPSAIDALRSIGSLVQAVRSYNSNNPATMPPPAAGSAAVKIAVDIGGGIGGQGGEGGDGGTVNVTNVGALETNGPGSPGILAESVGGGGGEGGAANPSAGSLISKTSTIDLSLGVGGAGGSAGNGGAVTVLNYGTIETTGDLSYGIHAESVGAGGGDGGATLAQNAFLADLSVALGGSGGSSGDGSRVSVELGGKGGPASVTTDGQDASAVLAQSIGGGGGLAYLMQSSFVGAGGTGRSGTGLSNGTVLPGVSLLSLTIDGAGGSAGIGGRVDVTAAAGSAVATSGTNAYGIMAQSVGGGGGLVVGYRADAATFGKLFGAPASGAVDGGPVTVQLGGNIGTTGAGSAGILAQSVGGGGGVIGGLSNVILGGPPVLTPKERSGQGGSVTVTLLGGSTIATTGADAPGVFAQSVGGGGGVLALANGQGFTFAGVPLGQCTVCSGAVIVNVSGSVAVSGAGSIGIYVESRGNGVNETAVTVDGPGVVTANPGAKAALFLAGSAENVVNVSGLVQGLGAGGVAIAGSGPVFVSNKGGTIVGSITAPPGSSVDNVAGGLIEAGPAVTLGPNDTFTNAASVLPGGGLAFRTTLLTGNFVQTGTGTLVIDTLARGDQSDHLQVSGDAILAGNLIVDPAGPGSPVPGSRVSDIVTAAGGVRDSSLHVVSGTPIVSYSLMQPDRDDLDLDTTVDFVAAPSLEATGLFSRTRRSIGEAFDTIEETGSPGALGPIAGAIAALPTAPALAATYDSLSGQSVVDAMQVSFSVQQQFEASVLQRIDGETGIGVPAAASHPIGLEAWIIGFGGNDLLKGAGGAASLQAQTAGAAFGVSDWFSDSLMAGVSVGGGSSRFSVSGETDDASDRSVNFALYGLARHGPLYVSGVLSYGNYDVNETRKGIGQLIGLDGATMSDFDQNAFGGRFEIGRVWSTGSLDLTPFASLDVDGLWQESVAEAPAGGSEEAAAVALHYRSQADVSVPSTLGARADWRVPLSGGQMLVPTLQFGWVHEFSSVRTLDAAFAAAPGVTFQTRGAEASRNAAETVAGAALSLTQSLSLIGTFQGTFSNVETELGGYAGIRAVW